MPMPPRGEPDWSKATPESDRRSPRTCPFPLLWKRKFWHRVVGHGDVDQAVAVDVEGGDAERLGHGHLQVGRADLDARLLADVGEPAAVVAQQAAERAR